MAPPRVALAPAGIRPWLAAAVEAGGAVIVEPDEADALVWTAHDQPAQLNHLLRAHSGIRWVQLPFAGIEPYLGVVDDERVWTSGKGVYSEPVAELALTLLLAGLRGVGHYARATEWTGPRGTNLVGAKVTILGAGGITEALLRMLGPFDADVTVVRRRPDPLPGAGRVLAIDDLDEALDGAEGVVLALALTPDTRGIIARPQLERMAGHGWLVNVARGGHVVTDDLVAALQDEVIGGAGLDVTDPEPLPDGHPLWAQPNCIVTPHVGNTPQMAIPLLSARITENVRRYADGQPLLGLVDPEHGY